MLIQIAQALSPALLAECQAMAADERLFKEGRLTAGWHARDRKHNLQARGEPVVDALLACRLCAENAFPDPGRRTPAQFRAHDDQPL